MPPFTATTEPAVPTHYEERLQRDLNWIQELVGITHFNCSFWFGDLSQARVLRSMELFAKDVMPAVE